MEATTLFRLAAETVLVAHVAFVAFVVGSLVLIVVGNTRGWTWIRNPLFRCAHLLSIGIVAVQAWFGIVCPLTTIENVLRARAGAEGYEHTFVSHWLRALLYYEAPDWIFMVCYTAFGALVALSWYLIPPRSFRHDDK